jgi:hypothetical protein
MCLRPAQICVMLIKNQNTKFEDQVHTIIPFVCTSLLHSWNDILTANQYDTYV